MPARRLTARWVLPIAAPAIEHGALLISDRGRIVSAGPDRDVPRPADAASETFADGILLPGLVNTHTHLELTGLEGYPPGPDFPAWIRQIRTRKAARPMDAFLEAARAGLARCHAAGVTTIADTGDSGAVIQVLSESGASGLAYHEVFGPHPDQWAESLAGLQAGVERLGRFVAGRARLGVSPHAPYTVSGSLYRAVARWAGAEGLPMAVHLAESPAESALLADGTGGFADAWRRRAIPLPTPPGRSPVEWLDEHDMLTPATLCIHVVHAGDGDIDRLRRAGSAVAHCPRSNTAHGHGDAPLRALRAAGLRLGLGTDSVLSVGELDLLAEARAGRRLAGLSAEAAVAFCTRDGARALGLDGETGSLAPGFWGDAVVIEATGGEDPFEQVLASGPEDVRITILGGKDVYRAERTA